MTAVREGSVRSDCSMEPVPAEGSGGLTRRPRGSGRVVAALGIVLAVLMGSLTTSISPVAATGGPSYSILATVTGLSGPNGVAVSPDGARVYVTVAPYYDEDPIPGTVKVINTSNNTVVATVTVGFGPSGVAVSPDGSRVYVPNADSGSVSVIDTSNNTVVATVTGLPGPSGVAVSPDGSRVYVPNVGGNSVSVINSSNNTVVATVTVGSGPRGVAVSPDGSRVYVPNVGGNSVSVINTSNNTVVATVTVGSFPNGVAVSPDGSRVYVANNGAGSVSVINTSNNTVVATVTVGSNPSGVEVSPDGSRVYVANQGGNSVSVINTSNNTVVATVTGLSLPFGLAVSPDGSRVYVANNGAGSVSVIDAGLPVTAPAAPTSLNATPGNGSASIAFTAGADGGAAISKYQYQVGSGSWTDAVGTTSPISISGLTNGTNYLIKLRAVNSAGDGAASDAVSVTPRTVPSAPSSLVATAGVGSASIAFTPGADGGAAITKYQYKVGNGSWTDAVGTSSPITVSGLTNYATVNIRLRAVNAAGAGAASAAVSVTPRQEGPAVTAATPSGRTGIVVTFNLNPLPGTTVAYQSVVAYARDTNTVRGTCRTYGRQTTCFIGGLTRGTNYDLRVTAHLPVPGKSWHNTTAAGSILQVSTNS
jgi:YVTN family beta-propeller protein